MVGAAARGYEGLLVGEEEGAEAHFVVGSVAPIQVTGLGLASANHWLVFGAVVPGAGQADFVPWADFDGLFQAIAVLPVEVPFFDTHGAHFVATLFSLDFNRSGQTASVHVQPNTVKEDGSGRA